MIRKLAEGAKLLNEGKDLAEACRHLKIAESTGHRWTNQFGAMLANDAKCLKLLNVQDFVTGESLAVNVQRSVTADDRRNVPDQLVAQHDKPTFLRCDNGPEFAACAIHDWCRFCGAATTFLDPGSRWRIGHLESSNLRIPDNYLNTHLFESLLEVQALLGGGCHDYLRERLRLSLGYPTPVKCEERWNEQHQQRGLVALDH